MPIEPEVLVLLSGGVDSAAAMAFFLDFGRPPTALFVDYGQAALLEESRAAAAVAAHFGVKLSLAKWAGPTTKGLGLIPGRNLFLISAALLEKPPSVTVIALGLHAGTSYADSSPPFVHALDHAIAAAGEPGVTIAAPFLEWTKSDVYAYAAQGRVPFPLTYSCEAAQGPCGRCLSCQDREGLSARP